MWFVVDSSDLILARQTVVTVVCGVNMITAIVWRRTVQNAGQRESAPLAPLSSAETKECLDEHDE